MGVYSFMGINARMLFSCKAVLPSSFPLIAISGRKKANKTFMCWSEEDAVYERQMVQQKEETRCHSFNKSSLNLTTLALARCPGFKSLPNHWLALCPGVTNHPSLPGTVLIVVLNILWSRNPLSSGKLKHLLLSVKEGNWFFCILWVWCGSQMR